VLLDITRLGKWCEVILGGVMVIVLAIGPKVCRLRPG
jgi:hypothetical protein